MRYNMGVQGNEMRPKDTHYSLAIYSISMTVSTLDMPKNIAISALRSAGTGDNLLAALEAIVISNSDDSEVEMSEPIEWTNAVNLENDNTEVNDTVIDF